MRQRRNGIPRHAGAHYLDAARIRHEKPREKLEKGRLAGAVRTEQSNEFAGTRDEADAVHRPDRSIGLYNVVQQQGWRRNYAAGAIVHQPITSQFAGGIALQAAPCQRAEWLSPPPG